MPTLVKFKRETPPLTDIAGQLRHWASQIETGEHGTVTTVLLILDSTEDRIPTVASFGEAKFASHLVGILEMAKRIF